MPLPTFVIIGERKSGTTALCHWMAAHPDVYMHPREDMNYFIEDEILVRRVWRDGDVDPARWERTHSADQYAELFAGGQGRRAIGEKSADLLFWRPTHERLARLLPACRFVLVLRNPVERAWSHYCDEVAKGPGREPLRFEEALAAENERSARSAYAQLHLSYRARGFYDQHIAAFWQHVPPERLMVVTLEEMRSRPKDTLKALYTFIGVDPDAGLDLAGTRHNESRAMLPREWARSPVIKPVANIYNRAVDGASRRLLKSAERRQRFKNVAYLPFRTPARGKSMPESIRTRLSRDYAASVDALERMLGRALPGWKVLEPAASRADG
ncbi:MAG TPA: sulfotransferase [Gemmatimonadaceae bacterium]